MSWYTNQIKKDSKQISSKKMMIKFDIIINWNQKLMDEIKKKSIKQKVQNKTNRN
jgi:hypothetical protein